jgi:hypothetical protein
MQILIKESVKHQMRELLMNEIVSKIFRESITQELKLILTAKEIYIAT